MLSSDNLITVLRYPAELLKYNHRVHEPREVEQKKKKKKKREMMMWYLAPIKARPFRAIQNLSVES